MHKHHERLDYLKHLIEVLNHYHGSKAEFVRRSRKLTGKAFKGNFPNRILSGEITFNKGLFDYMDEVIETAEEVLKKHREKDKNISNIKLYNLIQRDVSADFIQETLSEINQGFEVGNTSKAVMDMNQMMRMVDERKLLKTSRYTFGWMKQIFGKIQMQYKETWGTNGSLELTKQSINTFKQTGEDFLYLSSVNLLGHIYRQLEWYKDAVELYQKHQAAIDVAFLPQKTKQELKMNFKHQLGITLARVLETQNDDSITEEATKMFETSNAFYWDNTDDKSWKSLVVIREAELYVRSNELSKAANILEQYEDYHQIARMTPPRRTIFFRINTERYLKAGNITDALKNFHSGVHIATIEGYQHELEKLEVIYKKYPELQKRLPVGFSVYNPSWE